MTFAVLLGWIVVRTIQPGGGGNAAVAAVLLMVAVFFTVFPHELGHALVARRFGIRTLDLLKGLEQHGEGATVREAMRRTHEGIEVGSKIEEALSKLNENSEKTDSVLMVLDGDKLVGVVPMSNLRELLKIQKALNRAA